MHWEHTGKGTQCRYSVQKSAEVKHSTPARMVQKDKNHATPNPEGVMGQWISHRLLVGIQNAVSTLENH